MCAPAGAQALLPLVPKLMLKLQEEEDEEVQTLLLSTLSSCSRLDTLPALASGAISLLGHKLCHHSVGVRREAAAAMMALRSGGVSSSAPPRYTRSLRLAAAHQPFVCV